LFAATVATIDVFLKSFIIVSTHHWRHIASETVFNQNSFINRRYFFTESVFRFTMYQNLDSLIEYSLSLLQHVSET